MLKLLYDLLPASAKRRSRSALIQFATAINLAPIGSHFFFDVGRRLKNQNGKLIFDVGANVGQSAARFSFEFPKAEIFSFEPDADTFEILRERTKKLLRVRPYNLGFGSAEGRERFDNSSPNAELRRIAGSQSNVEFPLVQIDTIDGFCVRNKITAIDYLKIDTEGHDLEVLNGTKDMLSRDAVCIISTECSMNLDNKYHADFVDIHNFMASYNYRLFGIYEQVPEFVTNRPHLRRANAAYISSTVIANN